MNDETIDFTPTPYPMHGVFSTKDGGTFRLLLAGW